MSEESDLSNQLPVVKEFLICKEHLVVSTVESAYCWACSQRSRAETYQKQKDGASWYVPRVGSRTSDTTSG